MQYASKLGDEFGWEEVSGPTFVTCALDWGLGERQALPRLHERGSRINLSFILTSHQEARRSSIGWPRCDQKMRVEVDWVLPCLSDLALPCTPYRLE